MAKREKVWAAVLQGTKANTTATHPRSATLYLSSGVDPKRRQATIAKLKQGTATAEGKRAAREHAGVGIS